MLLQSGQAEQAATEFRAALAIDPNAFGPCYNLGLALLHLGRSDEAARQFEQVLRIRPDFAPAREKLQIANGRSRE